METLALLSDIHGNRVALEAVLADAEARGFGRLHSLGDLVGYGPDPNGVIDLIRGRGIDGILGNYDEGIGWDTSDCGCFYPDAQARLLGDASYAFTAAAVTAENKAFLRSLPREAHLALGGSTIHLVHGSPRRINEYLLRDRDVRTYLRLAKLEVDDALAFGHTHDPWWREYGGKLFVAAGSVGKPKDGDPRAAYVVLSAQEGRPMDVQIHRVEYDVEAVAAALAVTGLPAELADMLRRGG